MTNLSKKTQDFLSELENRGTVGMADLVDQMVYYFTISEYFATVNENARADYLHNALFLKDFFDSLNVQNASHENAALKELNNQQRQSLFELKSENSQLKSKVGGLEERLSTAEEILKVMDDSLKDKDKIIENSEINTRVS